jgi:hypothetical protein
MRHYIVVPKESLPLTNPHVLVVEHNGQSIVEVDDPAFDRDSSIGPRPDRLSGNGGLRAWRAAERLAREDEYTVQHKKLFGSRSTPATRRHDRAAQLQTLARSAPFRQPERRERITIIVPKRDASEANALYLKHSRTMQNANVFDGRVIIDGVEHAFVTMMPVVERAEQLRVDFAAQMPRASLHATDITRAAEERLGL